MGKSKVKRLRIKEPKRQILKLEARSIIFNGLEALEWALDKYKYNVSLSMLLEAMNFAFNKRNRIRFVRGSNRTPGDIKRYVSEGISYSDGFINVYVSPRSCNYVKQFGNHPNKRRDLYDLDRRNILLRESILTLTHELVHREQLKKFGKLPKTLDLDTVKYFSHPIEIEAFATEAAVEMDMLGRSSIARHYIDIFPPGHQVLGDLFKIMFQKYHKLTNGGELEFR